MTQPPVDRVRTAITRATDAAAAVKSAATAAADQAIADQAKQPPPQPPVGTESAHG